MIRLAFALFLCLCGVAQAQGPILPGPGLPYSSAPATTTWNPSDKDAGITLSGGNLIAAANTGSDQCARAIASTATAKVYWENTVNTRNAAAGSFNVVAVANASWPLTFVSATGANGSMGVTAATGPGYTTGDVLGIAVDATARLLWWRKNGGSWNPSGDPALGTGGLNIAAVTGALFPALQFNVSGDQITSNFGATAYANTAPSGYGNW